MSMRSGFSRFAKHVARAIGSPYAFAIAFTSIIAWAFLGPVMGFSERWQLIVNTGTTIVTFLVVFLIQTTQNRDARAVHLKLDELIHVISEARNKLIDCEDLTDEELDKLDEDFKKLRASSRTRTHPLAKLAEGK
jgi:low affinity Fe/Cu permease